MVQDYPIKNNVKNENSNLKVVWLNYLKCIMQWITLLTTIFVM